jgi:hypothetical protein
LLLNEIVIQPGEQFVIADESDFPELALYQGMGLLETGQTLTLDFTAGTIVNKAVFVLVASNISIVNFSTTEPLAIPAATLFTFNKLLVLGEPPQYAEGFALSKTSAQKTILDVIAGMKAAKK